MVTYLLQRLLISIPILLGITLLTFTIAHLMPGDYVDALVPPDMSMGGQVTPSPELRAYYGLDRPLPVQYLIWLRELSQGNLGYSFATGEPVSAEVAKRLPPTLRLTLTAMFFSLVTGTLLGIVSAVRQYSFLDHLLTVSGLVWISVPGFVLGLLALYLFYLKIPLFPLGQEGPLGQPSDVQTRVHHILLPALVLGLEGVAGYMRYVRSSLLDVLRQDYMAVARAKGLAERWVILRHGLRNALIPLITIVGLRLPVLLGGAFIIETIFNWPGIGRYAILSVSRRDYPVIMGLNLIVASSVLLSNLLADMAYAAADPRIRYGQSDSY